MPFAKLLLALCLLQLSGNASATESAIDIARATYKTPSGIAELLVGLRAYTANGRFADDQFISGDKVQHFLGGTLGMWQDDVSLLGVRSQWAPISNFDGLANTADLPCHILDGRVWVRFVGEQNQTTSLSPHFDANCKIQLRDVEQIFGKAWKPTVREPGFHPSPWHMYEADGIAYYLTPTGTMFFKFSASGLIGAAFKQFHLRNSQH